MDVDNIFGINSWLVEESLNGFKKGGYFSETRIDSTSDLTGELIRSWLLGKGYKLADIIPLKSCTVFFDQKSEDDLFKEFLDYLTALDMNLETEKIKADFKEEIIKFKKPLGINLSYLKPAEIRYFLDKLFIDKTASFQNFREIFLTAALKALFFEEFLHKRFVGAKRFSVEGLESFIGSLVLLKALSAKANLKNLILALPHRGRLAALHIWAGLPLESILAGFSNDIILEKDITGDVKYHWGFSTEEIFENQKIRLDVLPNPSHLESINPILYGYLYGSSRIIGETLGILAHGNSALCGQGVNQELLNFINCEGFNTPPVIHFVLDNLIGFTANPKEEKSTEFASDIFKTYSIPVIYVNSMDYDSVIQATVTAFEFCTTFKKDCVVHLFGYRKHGHNETDDPTVTQPKMYSEIKQITPAPLEYIRKWGFGDDLTEKCKILAGNPKPTPMPYFIQRSFKREVSPFTILTNNFLKELAEHIEKQISKVKLHPKIDELYRKRFESLNNAGPIDWGLAELIAFGIVLKSGKILRLVGEDSKRGTFGHRQICVWDTETEESVNVLTGFSTQNVEIFNSALSEYAALGFETGLSLNPEFFCLWEAQFGDFVNGAQIVIDQYLSSSYQKWQTRFPITLLLPHGQEGAGPEHSSARIERFLTLSAKDQWRLVIPSSAHSYLSFLISQISEDKPLILFTPKSLLRQKRTFIENLQFPFSPHPGYTYLERGTKQIVVCFGKAFYSVIDNYTGDILALDQIYPLPEQINKILARYDRIIFFQEEPLNQGVWPWFALKFKNLNIEVIAPEEETVPAVGFEKTFANQQENLIKILQQVTV